MSQKNDKKPTVGYGCPNTIDPHHVTVTIPRGRNEPVVITEHFGIDSRVGIPDEIERVILDRNKWSAIADDVRRVFNERLKENKIASSRWYVGTNKLERLLGKELLVLAWAIEYVEPDLVPIAVKNWSGLRPEERWWLFTMTAAASGGIHDGERGWRKALRFALSENPVDLPTLRPSPGPGKQDRKKSMVMSLFDDPQMSIFDQNKKV